VTLTYTGTLPDAVDISALPDGDTMLAVGVRDGTAPVQRTQAFTKTSGQIQLLLTSPSTQLAAGPIIMGRAAGLRMSLGF
jgi:hypothetical protein